MASFAIFSDERLEGVSDIIDTINDTGNSVEVICSWDATTGQLGRAAFAHHLVYPTDMVVVTPRILDLFFLTGRSGSTFRCSRQLKPPWITTLRRSAQCSWNCCPCPLLLESSLPTWWGSIPWPGRLCLGTSPYRPGRTALFPGSMTRSPGSTPGVVSPAFPLDVGSCTHARPRAASSGSMISGL